VGVTLSQGRLEEVLDRAYLVSTGKKPLPAKWIERTEQLSDSPSVAFIAAVGAALLAKATDGSVDSFAIQMKAAGPGAYSLRSPAKVLAQKRHAYGYDIGSSSDSDPINHGTLVSSKRWDLALERITPAHKPFFQVILGWLADVNGMSEEEAAEALAAYLRVRREVAHGGAVLLLPEMVSKTPRLADLVSALDGFVAADTERGARAMALVAAAFRAAGFRADLPSRNDPRRIDVSIRRGSKLVVGSEVKQKATQEAVADTLVNDTAALGASRALLAVLPPGELAGFDIPAVVRRAETSKEVVLRVVDSVRGVVQEALMMGDVDVPNFCAAMPRIFAECLRDIRATDSAIETWVAIASRWQGAPPVFANA
jgi:hypothetical protein